MRAQRRRRISAGLFASAISTFPIASALAVQVTTTFTGLSGASWNLASNWSGGVVPNNNIPAGTTYNVVIDGTATDKTAILAGTSPAIDNLTVTAGDTLSFNNSFDLGVAGTSISNAGTIALNGTSIQTDLSISSDALLSGGGTIIMGNSIVNRILGLGSTARLTNVNNIIMGSGSVSGLSLANQGTILANQSASLTMSILRTPNSNSGLIQANGGTIDIHGGGGSGTEVLDNTSGTIEADNGSIMRLHIMTVTGGTLKTTAAGQIQTPAGTVTLSGLTLDGSYLGTNASTTNIQGTITGLIVNSATLATTGSGVIQTLASDAATLSSLTVNGALLAQNGSTLSLRNGTTVSGSTLSTSGTGVIQTIASGTATLNNVTIAGTYVGRPAGTTNLQGTITNFGTISVQPAGVATHLALLGGSTVTLTGLGRVEIIGNVGGNFDGSGTLVSDNTIDGRGSIANFGLVNSGTVAADVAGSFLGIFPSGIFANSGTILATGGGTMLINPNMTLTNTGTLLAQNGSTISILNNLNVSGGTLATSGSGVIQTFGAGSATLTNITNTGNYVGKSGSTTNIQGVITNSGTISIQPAGFTTKLSLIGGSTVTMSGGGTVELVGQDAPAQLNGSGTLVNNITMRGRGSIVGIGLVNNGTILANVGSDVFNINPSSILSNSGTLLASGGGTMLINFTQFMSNSGTLLAQNGSTITLSGSLLVLTGGTLATSGTGVIQTPTGGTVTLDTLTNTGLYVGQPTSLTMLAGTISNTGTVQIAAGATLATSGTPTVTGGTYVIDGQFTILNSTLSLSAVSGAGTVLNSFGTVSVQSLRVGTVSIASTKKITVRPDGGPNGTSRLANMPVLPGTAKLDLSDNDLVLDYSSGSPITIATIRTALANAFAGGSWSGSGITSSSAGASPLIGKTALGYRDALSMFGAGGGTFSGQNVDDTTMLIKYTYAADATLDGVVDVKDLMALALHFNAAGTWAWDQGDFDYNGQVNIADLTTLARNWQMGAGTPLGPSLEASFASLGLPQVSVPEPSTATVAFVLLAASLGRRRQRVSRGQIAR